MTRLPGIVGHDPLNLPERHPDPPEEELAYCAGCNHPAEWEDLKKCECCKEDFCRDCMFCETAVCIECAEGIEVAAEHEEFEERS